MALRRALLLLVVLVAAAISSACGLPVALPRRQLTALRKLLQGGAPIAAGSQLPSNVSQCEWDEAFPAQCTLSLAGLFTANASYLNASAYAARAHALVAAGDLHCGTLDKASCSWPCQWDNVNTCYLADQPRLTVFDCPDSPARAYFTCPEAPRRTRAWCLATPGCSFVPQPNSDGLRACEATFYANMTPAQRLDFGGAGYWVRMPREILGCCKGSTYRYTRSTLCRPGANSEASCTAIKGCGWRATDGACVPTPEQEVAMLFSDAPSDPLNAPLQAMAKECAAITSASACNAYKPVAIDARKVLAYLDQDLDVINTAVNETLCVLPSDLA